MSQEVYVAIRTTMRLNGFEVQTFKTVSAEVAAILQARSNARLKFKVDKLRVFTTSVIVEFVENSREFIQFFGDPYLDGDYDLVDLILAQRRDDEMALMISGITSFLAKAEYNESKQLKKVWENLSFYEEKSIHLSGWGLKAQQKIEVLMERLKELTGLIGAMELGKILERNGPYFDPQVISIVADYFEQETEWDVPISSDIGAFIKYYSATPPFWEDFHKVTKSQLESLLNEQRISITYIHEIVRMSGAEVIRELLEFLNKRQLDRLYLCHTTIYPTPDEWTNFIEDMPLD